MSPKRERPVSPLGMGHAPVKDPIKGLSGVLSGTLVMEAITVLLILLVVLKVDGGEHWTTFNWVYITVIGLAHLALAFMQKRPWALWADLGLQIPLIFGIVWFFIVKLRSEMVQRMRHGYLVTQHLGADVE